MCECAVALSNASRPSRTPVTYSSKVSCDMCGLVQGVEKRLSGRTQRWMVSRYCSYHDTAWTCVADGLQRTVYFPRIDASSVQRQARLGVAWEVNSALYFSTVRQEATRARSRFFPSFYHPPPSLKYRITRAGGTGKPLVVPEQPELCIVYSTRVQAGVGSCFPPRHSTAAEFVKV